MKFDEAFIERIRAIIDPKKGLDIISYEQLERELNNKIVFDYIASKMPTGKIDKNKKGLMEIAQRYLKSARVVAALDASAGYETRYSALKDLNIPEEYIAAIIRCYTDQQETLRFKKTRQESQEKINSLLDEIENAKEPKTIGYKLKIFFDCHKSSFDIGPHDSSFDIGPLSKIVMQIANLTQIESYDLIEQYDIRFAKKIVEDENFLNIVQEDISLDEMEDRIVTELGYGEPQVEAALKIYFEKVGEEILQSLKTKKRGRKPASCSKDGVEPGDE